MKGLSIVLPTFNERKNLPILLEKISRVCRKTCYEVIVVDDNSPDGTALLAKSLKKKYPNLRVFVRKKERGLASAIFFGVKKAKYRLVCVMDTDLQHPPSLIPKMYFTMERKNSDVVIASRFVSKSKLKNFPLYRYFLSRLAIFLLHLIFPKLKSVKDPLSGFFLLKKSILPKKMNLIGYKFLLELLIKSKDLKVTEIPFVFGERKFGKSKLGLKEVLKFFILLYKLRH